MLGLLLLGLRRWYGFALVSDAHYVGVRALRGGRLLQSVLDFHNARADLVIVTNERHAAHVAALGGRAYVCPDPLPDLGVWTATRPVPDKAAFLVCSFERDEPFEAVFRGFSGLPQSLFVSGRYTRRGRSAFPDALPRYISSRAYAPQILRGDHRSDRARLPAVRGPKPWPRANRWSSPIPAPGKQPGPPRCSENTAEQIARTLRAPSAARGNKASKWVCARNTWAAGARKRCARSTCAWRRLRKSRWPPDIPRALACDHACTA